MALDNFLEFFSKNEKSSKIGSSFLEFSNSSSLLDFDFLKILKIYPCSVQKELSIDIKISQWYDCIAGEE